MENLLDHDRLVNAPAKEVAQASYTILDAVQKLRPEAQVLGAAAYFLASCTRFGVPAQDAFSAVTNLMNEGDGLREEFAAIQAYMEAEL